MDGTPLETPSSWDWGWDVPMRTLLSVPFVAPRLLETEPRWYQLRAASLGDRLG